MSEPCARYLDAFLDLLAYFNFTPMLAGLVDQLTESLEPLVRKLGERFGQEEALAGLDEGEVLKPWLAHYDRLGSAPGASASVIR